MLKKRVFENILKIYCNHNRSVGTHNAGSIPATPSYGERHGKKNENKKHRIMEILEIERKKEMCKNALI